MPPNKFQPDSQYPNATGTRAAAARTAQAARRRLDEINSEKDPGIMKTNPTPTNGPAPVPLIERIATALGATVPPVAAVLASVLDEVDAGIATAMPTRPMRRPWTR